MNCPFCSNEIQATAKFCKYCGKKLPEAPTASGDSAAASPEAPRRTQPPKRIQAVPVQNQCKRCGKPCPEGSVLCAQCVSRAMSQSAPQGGSPAPNPAPPAPPRQPAAPNRSGARFPIGAAAAVLVLLLAAGGGFLAWRAFSPARSDDSTPAAVTSQDADEQAPVEGTGASPEAEDGNAPVQEGTEQNNSDAAPVSPVATLPQEVTAGPWDDTRTLQGMQWDTDSLGRYFVSNGRSVYAYDRDGELVAKSEDVGKARLYSLDYYDGRVFCMMRSSDNGRFKLKIYDASSLKLVASMNLIDMHMAYTADKKTYQSDLMPAIDAIVVAPRFGGGGDMKIYVSYNVYLDSKHPEALNWKQQIYEYDYYSALADPEEFFAERTLELDLGQVDFGLQTLEYEPDTNRMWCAVREGAGHKSLYCLDWDTLEMVKNGEQDGWDCPNAGNGFCSVGEDTYYVMIPSYKNNYSSARIVKVSGKDLEDVG